MEIHTTNPDTLDSTGHDDTKGYSLTLAYLNLDNDIETEFIYGSLERLLEVLDSVMRRHCNRFNYYYERFHLMFPSAVAFTKKKQKKMIVGMDGNLKLLVRSHHNDLYRLKWEDLPDSVIEACLDEFEVAYRVAITTEDGSSNF